MASNTETLAPRSQNQDLHINAQGAQTFSGPRSDVSANDDIGSNWPLSPVSAPSPLVRPQETGRTLDSDAADGSGVGYRPIQDDDIAPIHTQRDTRVLFAPSELSQQNVSTTQVKTNEEPHLSEKPKEQNTLAPPDNKVPINDHHARYLAETKAIKEGKPAPRIRPTEPPPPGYVTPLQLLGEQPARVDCPVCKAAVTTRVHKESKDEAGLWACAICCCLGPLCAWIPFVMDDCKDHYHNCSQCNVAFGVYRGHNDFAINPRLVFQNTAVPGAPVGYRKSDYVQSGDNKGAYAAQVPMEAQEPRELNATDNKFIGHEADGTPVAELGQSKRETGMVHELPGQSLGSPDGQTKPDAEIEKQVPEPEKSPAGNHTQS